MTVQPDLRALAEKATPGPWGAADANGLVVQLPEHVAQPPVAVCDFTTGDAEFVAACDPQTILALLDQLDRLQAVADAARPVLDDAVALLDQHTSPEVMRETRLRFIENAQRLSAALGEQQETR